MMQCVLASGKFFAELARVDRSTADRVQREGCPHCGDRLHVANFPRKPRGLPVWLGPSWRWRWSFCCAGDGCRRRQTPPSVRFFGRRLYPAVLLLFVGLLATSPRPSAAFGWTASRQRHAIGRRTWRRWLGWWRREFPATSAARVLEHRFVGRAPLLVVYRRLSGAPPGRMLCLLSLVSLASLVPPLRA